MAIPIKSKNPKVKDVRGKKPGTPTQPEANKAYTSPAVWKERYAKAASNQTNLFERFGQWYDLMYAVVNDKDFAPWRSRVFVPMLAGKAWAMISKFTSSQPGWEVIVRDDYDADDDGNTDEAARQERQDKAQKKLEFDWTNPDLEESIRDKIVACLIDSVVTGTGLAKIPWTVKKKQRKEWLVKEDYSFDFSKEVVYDKTVGYNDVIPVNIFNVFIAPSSTSLQQAPWIIIREFKTLAELKATNEAFGGEFYKNLSALEGVGGTADEYAQYNRARNRLTGEEDKVAADNTIDMVETFECYDKAKNTICLYAASRAKDTAGKTSWLPLREAKNTYWHGKFPLVPFYVRRRPHEFWGEGAFEVSHRLQAAANDLFNHYLDNWNLSIDGMIMAEQSSNVTDFILEPGGLITYSGERPSQFKFPEPSPAQLSVVMNEIKAAVEENTISQYAMGNPSSTLDKTQGTATGVLRIQEAANDLIGFMRDNFVQSVLQIGRFFLSNNQQFLHNETKIELMKSGKMQTDKVGPEDFHGELDVRIDEASMQSTSKIERRESFMGYTAMLRELQAASVQQNQISGTPIVNLDLNKIMEDAARYYGQRSGNTYIMAQEEVDETPMGIQQEQDLLARAQVEEQLMAPPEEAML